MNDKHSTNRRTFIKASGTAAVAASTIAFPSVTFGKPDSRKLKIGFIGCGGRGTGAINQALTADSNCELYAMGEVFRDKLDRSLKSVQGRRPGQINLDEKRKFVGLDAYQKVLESGVDLVILTTPPGFRPLHFKAAVEAGKHIFLEKPMATDAPGLQSVMESYKLAEKKGLAVVAGFCWRYEPGRREFFKRIADGAIGDVQSMYSTYYTGPVKPMPPDSSRKAEWSDIEWQVRNWYNFAWCGGDGLLEQAVHSVDKISWVFGDKPPHSCVAVGGRQRPNNSGNIWDHIEVNYLFEGGARGHLGQRQIPGCHGETNDYILGTKGRAQIGGGLIITGKDAIKGKTDKWTYNPKGDLWRYTGPGGNMYQIEHDELFASIRDGKPINNGARMCNATGMALMGRMSGYTGRQITWDQAMNSKQNLFPKDQNWETGKHTPPKEAIPGTKEAIAPHGW
jgi:predicted dehydrogenase